MTFPYVSFKSSRCRISFVSKVAGDVHDASLLKDRVYHGRWYSPNARATSYQSRTRLFSGAEAFVSCIQENAPRVVYPRKRSPLDTHSRVCDKCGVPVVGAFLHLSFLRHISRLIHLNVLVISITFRPILRLTRIYDSCQGTAADLGLIANELRLNLRGAYMRG